jgi:2,4-dienoyl-CoA reductase (NADPH2)
VFDHVFAPIRIGRLTLGHRIMMGSMHLNLETVGDGSDLAAFYAERVRGGVDLVVTGGMAVNKAGAGSASYAVLTETADRARLGRVADAVHAAGGHIALQLFHAGRYAFAEAFGISPLAP